MLFADYLFMITQRFSDSQKCSGLGLSINYVALFGQFFFSSICYGMVALAPDLLSRPVLPMQS